ncbi:apoptosis-resistant E3 ubiquitin protein ligase 1 [Dendropsophus ebraccatus]|uniref:apoptosis-resistant E3 ubiquitin protein ligase 1 n=1 Tax=Dendropsophus ebraccatus TaxID=150705 RepID=UPI0038316A35
MLYLIGGVTGFMCVLLVTIKFLFELSSRVLTFWHHEGRERGSERTIYNYVRGKYLEPRSCQVVFDWKEPCEVGQSMGFRVHLFYRNGHPFPVSSTGALRVLITHTELSLEVPVTLEVMADPLRNVIKAAFTVRRSGRYQISISVGGLGVGSSPYYKAFHPDSAPLIRLLLLQLGVVGMADGCCQTTVCHGKQSRLLMHLTLLQTGCFQATLRYQGRPISNGHFIIIVLSDAEKAAVDSNVARSGVGVFFEGYLYPPSSPPNLSAQQNPSSPSQKEESAPLWSSTALERMKKPKKVYFYISPKQLSVKEFYLRIIPWRLFTFRVCPGTKQLSVKEFYLRIIPWRLFTFRVCPGTKFLYLPPDPLHGLLSLQVDDGLQPPIEISCKERNIMAATFTRFLHLNIGGSETFQDKVTFFQKELKLIHCKKNRSKTTLRVSRHSLLESSLRATRNFSASDWSKSFEVIFQDEEALDWGGPRREWFELICKVLFDTNNKLFTRFSDTSQGLVHPNPCRPPGVRLKLYEFAGRVVGKCLFESSQGGGYEQLVRARFTRSFLAQIIGLRMHYKIQGVSLGAKFSPPLANIVMSCLEEKYIFSANNKFLKHIQWIGGYIDDLVLVWKDSEDSFKLFAEYINNNEYGLKFTTCFGGNEVSFLDVRLVADTDNNCVQILPYRKDCAGNSILMATSCHPPHVIQNMPYGECLRLKRNCSKQDTYELELEKLKDRFPPEMLDSAIERAALVSREDLLSEELSNRKKKSKDRSDNKQSPADKMAATPLTRQATQKQASTFSDLSQSVPEILRPAATLLPSPTAEGTRDTAASLVSATLLAELPYSHAWMLRMLRTDTHIDDLENRGRRNNVKIRGLPEDVGPDQLVKEVRMIFNRYLGDPDDTHIELDRTHRVAGPRSQDRNRPRDVLCRVHYYQQKEALMQRAWELGPIDYAGVEVSLLPDLSSCTLAMRRLLRPLLSAIKDQGASFRWGYPFHLIIRHSGTTCIVRSPEDLPEALSLLGLSSLSIPNWTAPVLPSLISDQATEDRAPRPARRLNHSPLRRGFRSPR